VSGASAALFLSSAIQNKAANRTPAGDAIGLRELPMPSAIRRFMQVDVLRLKKREAPV
jgi:hypothetical protein